MISRYIKYACFFLLVQFLSRLIILIRHDLFDKLSESLVSTYVHGFSLDLAFVSYLILCMLLFDIILPFSWKKIRAIFIGVTTGLQLFLALVDSELIYSWKSKFNQDALQFLKFPQEAIASMGLSKILITLLFCSIVGWLFYKFAKKFLSLNEFRIKPLVKYLAISCFLVLALFGARQSLGVAPIGPSKAFYSNNAFNNLAALNSNWNFINQLFLPIDYIDLKSFDFAGNTGKSDYFEGDSSEAVQFQFKNVNCVLIVLESFNAYLSKDFGGLQDHTPFLDSLANNGIGFYNLYASTNRTDKALASINSGFPGTPWNSILHEPNKAKKLDQIADGFNKLNYHSAFYYGGDLSFANMNAYLNGHFNKVYDLENWPKRNLSKWGVHDEILFEEYFKKPHIEPFFDEVLTLSSHEPFDVPRDYKLPKGPYQPFYNSVRYTDECLAKFFAQAKTKDWYKNTIFILVSDHGRNIGVKGGENDNRICYKIPLIIFGEPLKGKVERINTVKSQNDLAKTISLLWNFKDIDLPFSRNLFESSGAFYFKNGGWGLLDSTHSDIDNEYFKTLNKSNNLTNHLKKGAGIQYQILEYYKSL